MKTAQQFTEEWQANAIAQSRANPKLAAEEAAGELCIECMTPHPCFCDDTRAISEMRKWYEGHRVPRGVFDRPKTEIIEPKLTGNWGRDLDGLMTGLLKIARKPYEAEIERLRAKLKSP